MDVLLHSLQRAMQYHIILSRAITHSTELDVDFFYLFTYSSNILQATSHDFI